MRQGWKRGNRSLRIKRKDDEISRRWDHEISMIFWKEIAYAQRWWYMYAFFTEFIVHCWEVELYFLEKLIVQIRHLSAEIPSSTFPLLNPRHRFRCSAQSGQHEGWKNINVVEKKKKKKSCLLKLYPIPSGTRWYTHFFLFFFSLTPWLRNARPSTSCIVRVEWKTKSCLFLFFFFF